MFFLTNPSREARHPLKKGAKKVEKKPATRDFKATLINPGIAGILKTLKTILSVCAGGIRRRFFLFLLVSVFTMLPCSAAEPLTFDNLYQSNGVLGLRFSPHTQSFKGLSVKMRGYMAPPLKPESKFFVLTRQPVAICPFCSSDAEWPIDIVVVYLKDKLSPTNFSDKIEVEGTLELGSWIDPQTGFVSQVRIVNAVFRRPSA